jgi:hypothetical protein
MSPSKTNDSNLSESLQRYHAIRTSETAGESDKLLALISSAEIYLKLNEFSIASTCFSTILKIVSNLTLRDLKKIENLMLRVSGLWIEIIAAHSLTAIPQVISGRFLARETLERMKWYLVISPPSSKSLEAYIIGILSEYSDDIKYVASEWLSIRGLVNPQSSIASILDAIFILYDLEKARKLTKRPSPNISISVKNKIENLLAKINSKLID